MENEVKESLDNVSDIEEKSREAVQPDFAAAVKEIKEDDKKRDAANELPKAPKEGEEVLPKEMKLILDESWFDGEDKDSDGKLIKKISVEIYDDGIAYLSEENSSGWSYHIDTTKPDTIVEAFSDYLFDSMYPEGKLEEATLINKIKADPDEEVKEKFTADMSLRDAYKIFDPEEFQMDEIRDDLTIGEAWEKMKKGEDIYVFASVDGKGFDSAVREGIFEIISSTFGIDYDKIYNLWLHGPLEEEIEPKKEAIRTIKGIKRLNRKV